MPMIQNLPAFTQAVRENEPVVCNKDGTWYIENRYLYYFKCLFGHENQRLLNIARLASASFYELEKQKVIFDAGRRLIAQPFDYSVWLTNNLVVEAALQKLPQSDRVTKARTQINAHSTALKYRLDCNAHGSLPVQDHEISQIQLDLVTQIARTWKSQQDNMPIQVLTDWDEKCLRQMCRYREFTHLFLNLHAGASTDDIAHFQDDVLNWIIRDLNPIEVLIKFPGRVKWTKDCYLSQRFEDGKHTCLKLQYLPGEHGTESLDLTLPFVEKGERIVDISILDEEKKVEFRGNRTMTIKEIFEEQFAKKQECNGEMEFLDHWGPEKKPAIDLWDSHTWGYRDAEGKFHSLVDLTKPDWYKSIPVSEILSLQQAKEAFEVPFVWQDWFIKTQTQFPLHQDWCSWIATKKSENPNWDQLISEAKEKYGEEGKNLVFWLREAKNHYAPVDGRNWIAFGGSTRTDLNSNDIDGSHGVFVFVVPNEEDGSYEVRILGKFADPYPVGIIPQIKFFAGSHRAVVQSPDTNKKYHWRQMTPYSELIIPKDIALNGIEKIRQDALNSRENMLVFQYQTEGCAKFVHDIVSCMREKLELSGLNPFYARNIKARPKGVLGFIHRLCRPFPEIVMKTTMLIFAPWRGRIGISNGVKKLIRYWGTQAWEEFKYYSPATLHYRQIKELKRFKAGLPLKYPGLLPKKIPAFLLKAATVA